MGLVLVLKFEMIVALGLVLVQAVLGLWHCVACMQHGLSSVSALAQVDAVRSSLGFRFFFSYLEL